MVFNEKQISLLKEIYENNNRVLIEGVNGRGQEFETIGEIATNDLGNPAIREDGLYMEFGKHEDTNRSKFFGKFLLEFYIKSDIKEAMSQLIIKSIKDKEGNIVFENADFELQLDKIKESNIELDLEETTFLSDNLMEKMDELIGKPVVLVDDEQTLEGISCGMVPKLIGGKVTAVLLSEIICKTYDIKPETKLYTKNNEGKFFVAADNSAKAEIDENLDYLLL